MNYSERTHNRDCSIDIARGIAILGMLFGHAMAWKDIHGTILTHWFWSFNMPLFALVAGYFYKDKPFLISLKNSIKTLLIPCFVVSFLLLVINFSARVIIPPGGGK